VGRPRRRGYAPGVMSTLRTLVGHSRHGLLLSLILGVFSGLGTSGLCTAQSMGYDELVQQIDQAVRLGDQKKIERFVDRETTQIVRWLRGAYFAARTGQPVAANKLQAVVDAWSTVFQGSTFPSVQESWIQRLDGNQIQILSRAETDLVNVYAAYANAVDKGAVTAQTADSLLKLTRTFDTLGDAYSSSLAWSYLAIVWRQKPQGGPEALREGIYAAQQFLVSRESVDFTQDTFYGQWKDWIESAKQQLEAKVKENDKREEEGYSADASAIEKVLMPDAERLTFELEPVVMKQPKERDLALQAGDLPSYWPSLTLREDPVGKLSFFTAADLWVVRAGVTKFGIARDEAEKSPEGGKWQPIEAPNGIQEPSVFDLPGSGRKYGMWFYTGSTNERYQGVQQNFAPSPDLSIIFYKSAMQWEGEVLDEEIKIWDDNSSGKLFEDPMSAAFTSALVNPDPENDQLASIPTFDAIQVGKRGEIQPLGGWIQIDKDWYRIEGSEDGTKIELRQANPEYFKTGKIKLQFGGKDIDVEALIIEGLGDVIGDARFDISSGKNVEVPAGTYRIVYGKIASGSGVNQVRAWLFPGAAETFEVAEDKSEKLRLGAPFSLDFVRGGDEEQLELSAFTFKVRGVGGEIYTNLEGAVVAPEVLTAVNDKGRGAKPIAEFRAPASPEDVNILAKNERLGSSAAFFPYVSGENPLTQKLSIAIRKGVKVGLKDDRNKLFGKFETIWK
jgi:hypothetical protein